MDIIKTTIRNLQRLERTLAEPYSDIIRDAALMQFSYSYEAFWRMLAKHLTDHHGKIIKSPKQCFRVAFSTELINANEREICNMMTADKNMEIDENYEKNCDIVFGRLKSYAEAMGKVVGRMVV